MIPPETIPFESIELGERGRTVYQRIEELAQSIHDNGLIQPIVLVPLPFKEASTIDNVQMKFGLDAGGRRYQALKQLGVKELHHATTSDPARPGYVLKGEDQATPLRRLFTEIAENLDRDNLDWRDEMKLLTRAYRLAETEANAEGKHILMRDFGAMLSVGYADLQAATVIHDDVIKNPERYKDCNGIRAAYSVLLKCNAQELTKLTALKSMQTTPLKSPQIVVSDDPQKVSAQPEPEPTAITVPISQHFFNHNALDFMYGLPNSQFDHIITDPDYGISVELLESNMGNAAAGVIQESVEHSLADMERFIKLSWNVIKPQGFLVFFYDLDHHEKLQRMAIDVGYAVQRWPLIWHKSDYRSNAAPAHNFCKNIEYAMVCRKPSSVLARAQLSSVYTCATGTVTRDFGHPFAKPLELWQWIYSAICIKGQVVYDPFVGRGSSAVAAVKWGLRPVGSETNPDHYHGLLHNLQNFYRKELGPSVTFN